MYVQHFSITLRRYSFRFRRAHRKTNSPIFANDDGIGDLLLQVLPFPFIIYADNQWFLIGDHGYDGFAQVQKRNTRDKRLMSCAAKMRPKIFAIRCSDFSSRVDFLVRVFK